MQAADFLADEISISSLCSELGHRVFDASTFHHFTNTPAEPVSACMTTLISEDIIDSRESTTTESNESPSASVFGMMAGLRGSQGLVAVGDACAPMAEEDYNSPIATTPSGAETRCVVVAVVRKFHWLLCCLL